MVDIFSQFLECSWRGISFPIQNISENISQTMVPHRKMDRDGAQVEGTGLAPLHYQVKAYFINSIAKGKQETWSNLFPDTWLQFRDAIKDRTTGILVHPLYGQITCKPLSLSHNINSDERGGVIADCQFLETVDSDAEQVIQQSAVAQATSAAIDLDASLAQLSPPIDTGLQQDGFANFTDMVNSFTSVVDQVQLIGNKVSGKIDSVIAKVDKLTDKVNTATEIITTNPVTLVQTKTKKIVNSIGLIQDSQYKLLEALFLMKVELGLKNTDINFYKVPKTTTLASLTLATKNSSSELIDLNPELVSNLRVKKDTLVKYYNK